MAFHGRTVHSIASESWELPIVGYEVLEVWFSGQVYLIAYGEKGADESVAPRTGISFGGKFLYMGAKMEQVVLDAEAPWSTLCALLNLRHVRITAARADNGGHLKLRFQDGSIIKAGPDQQYENWGVSGPGHLMLAAPPGGGDPRIGT